MKKYIAIAALLVAAGLGFRMLLALELPNDEPDDGRLYARIANNVIEHRSYSIALEEPYSPTFIRVPGYPVFLASIYSIFGRDNNRAVRAVQAVIDTGTCLLIALLALSWAPGGLEREKRHRLFLIALAMAVACPFLAIYVTTILTETSTTFLIVLSALAASMALRAETPGKSASWCVLAGLSGGIATLFRPDSGIFVAGVGFTLVIVLLYRAISKRPRTLSSRSFLLLKRPLIVGTALTFGFAVALAPWTIRNARVFGVFQPIAPAQANMPEEFVPMGYVRWLKTWVDDVKYTETLEWSLDEKPIHVEQLPDYAFDSPEERERIAALFERYNNPESASLRAEANSNATPAPPPVEPKQPTTEGPPEASPSEEGSEEPESREEEEPESPDAQEEVNQPVEMTREIDAGFAEVARERIARHPIRYYLIVPLKRASSLWFDTHSQYYPFQGELFPLAALDRDLHQQFWLPVFMLLTLLYTSLGLAGAWLMWRQRTSCAWLLLFVLLIVPRFAFLTSMENPEPRYVVEFFAFVTAAGSLAVAASWEWLSSRRRSREPNLIRG